MYSSIQYIQYMCAYMALLTNFVMCWFFWKVFEVAPSFYMVELRKASGDNLEYHKVSQTFLIV